MPVTKTGMGYSDKTPEKEFDFAYLAKLVASKVRGLEIYSGKKLPFYYIDTHAGNGYNHEIGCIGSPIVVLKAIQEAGIHTFQAILIDKNKSNCHTLRANFINDPRITVRKNDCRHVLSAIGPSIQGYGIMVVDPNGDPYFDMLADFFKNEGTSKIDVCIRLGATNWKRVITVHNRSDLFDGIHNIDKNYWYLKRPAIGDPFQWTTIFGTNNPGLKPAQNKGFISIETDEGQCVLNVLNHTRNTPVNDYKAGQLPIDVFFRRSGS
ncbi:MAG: hypothetical protein PHH09_13865 [Methanoregulaceae archaeon]|nr:hypothetical protein [Methanoregulaceae archaeon]